MHQDRTRSLLGLCAAAAIATLPAHAEPAGTSAEVEAAYHLQADQNRYLVKELWNPEDTSQAKPRAPYYMQVASNMEPRMVHCEQMAESLGKLKSQGYCTQAVPSQVLKACPNLKPFATPVASCKRPNILIFLVDDMGWGDFQPYGGGVTYGAATPATSKLAQRGLLLTSTYSQPTCSPSRATIHTGQLPVHHGVLYPPMYGDPGGLNVSSITLPWMLKKAGYVTKGTGKWHMGENRDNLPQNVGYDEYLGFLSVSDMYTEWRDQYYNPEVVRDEERTTYMDHSKFSHYMIHATSTPSKEAEFFAKEQSQGQGAEPKAPGCEALAEITLPWEAEALQGKPNRGNSNHCWVKPENKGRKISIADLDRVWADDSVAFIERMKDRSEPWFLYHATRGCHFDNYPNTGDRRFSYARTVYSDCTAEMDLTLGRVMQALADSGQENETLVFFTSDNGPEDEIPPHGHTPFRGGKGDTWEGGVRVPGIAFWPGMIEAGRISDGLFDQADLYTTALNLAGINYADPTADPVIAKEPELGKKLAQRYLYGIDQTSFLLAREGASNRRSELHWWLTKFGAVRMDELKAHVKVTMPAGLSQGYPGGLSGLDFDVSYLWLFNLQEDPKEQDNINIRHLWPQHLFSAEFNRFMCVLTRYPPHLPTQPAEEMNAMNQIKGLTESLKYYYEACHTAPPKSSGGT